MSCNQQVEPAQDWRSDCLEKQSLLVIELCGILGRLHSMQGLAQSNNNARLNYSAKHVTKLLETKCKRWSKVRKKKNTEKEVQQGAHTACAQPEPSLPPNKQIAHLLAVSFFCFFFCFFFLFFRRNSQTDYMNKGKQMSKLPHTLFQEG